jgi:hypothetical protein
VHKLLHLGQNHQYFLTGFLWLTYLQNHNTEPCS